MDIRYTAEHEWVAIEGDTATVGITDHAQGILGDLVFVALPSIGQVVAKGSTIGTVESVKAASDVFAPLSGTVVSVNSALTDDPSLVNTDPTGAGWLFQIQFSAAAELTGLLSADDYERLTK